MFVRMSQPLILALVSSKEQVQNSEILVLSFFYEITMTKIIYKNFVKKVTMISIFYIVIDLIKDLQRNIHEIKAVYNALS